MKFGFNAENLPISLFCIGFGIMLIFLSKKMNKGGEQ